MSAEVVERHSRGRVVHLCAESRVVALAAGMRELGEIVSTVLSHDLHKRPVLVDYLAIAVP